MKYNIILADPPWAYKDRRNTHPRLCGGALSHYPTMPIEDIKALAINEVADTNCMLFLWATPPNIQYALDTIKAWGFVYKTFGFTWVKTNKKSGGPFFGIGYYTKSNAEVCLIGVKGKPIKVSNSVSQVIIAPKMEHSRKPDEVKDKIVQLCGDIPRLELFARQKTEGWDVFGNQVKDSIMLPRMSTCCNYPIRVVGNTTQFYVCRKCGKPCDVILSIDESEKYASS